MIEEVDPFAGVPILAAELPLMQSPALKLLAERPVSPIVTYLGLIDEVHKVALTSPDALQYRTKFNGYYGVRRGEQWRQQFYYLFEQLKVDTRTADELFEALLRALTQTTGRVEASFASKAVATLRCTGPVIDSVVRRRLSNLPGAVPFGKGIESRLAYYRWLSKFIACLANTANAKSWERVFDKRFKAVPNAVQIHIHKKLDFLIWAGGRAD